MNVTTPHALHTCIGGRARGILQGIGVVSMPECPTRSSRAGLSVVVVCVYPLGGQARVALADVSVPSAYGTTADENPFAAQA